MDGWGKEQAGTETQDISIPTNLISPISMSDMCSATLHQCHTTGRALAAMHSIPPGGRGM